MATTKKVCCLSLILVLLSGPLMASPLIVDEAIQESVAYQTYLEMVKSIQLLKAQNDTLNEIRLLYKDANASYQSVKQFDPQRYVNQVLDDYEDLTGLDNMQGLSLDQRLNVIEAEMDKRIAGASTRGQKQRSMQEKAQFKREAELIQIEMAARHRALQAQSELDISSANRITAASTANMAEMLANIKREQESSEHQQEKQRQSEDALFQESVQLYRTIRPISAAAENGGQR